VKVQGPALQALLAQRGFDVPSAADRTGIPRQILDNVIRAEGELSALEVSALAGALAVPIVALFSNRPPELLQALDFRKKTPGRTRFAQPTLDAIAYVEHIASVLADMDLDTSPAQDTQEAVSDHSEASAKRLAAKWRKNWGLSAEDQLEFKDPNRLYISLRGFIEGLGVLVMHRSFDADDAAGIYANIGVGPHIIVINTSGSSKARKCFTLAHEFGHFLIRAVGVSNPSVLKNDVERFCNIFAAYLLAPDTLVSMALQQLGQKASIDSDFVRLFARRLSISQEAAVRRLVEAGQLSSADYAQWRSRFNGLVPPADMEDGGGGRANPLQTKRTTYGARFLELLGQAKKSGALDEIGVYRLCGLKPKYQSELLVA
jgi:Zn-dependent peptidase ImmA (M78 family)